MWHARLKMLGEGGIGHCHSYTCPTVKVLNPWLLPTDGGDLSGLSARNGVVRSKNRNCGADASCSGNPAQTAEDPREPRKQVRKQADEYEYRDGFRAFGEAAEVVNRFLAADFGGKPPLGRERGK